MSPNHERSFTLRVLYAFLFLAGMIPVGGCSDVVERRWSEDVALDDGRVIVIDRYVKFKESNSLAGDVYSSTDLESKLGFRDELSSLPMWSVPLVPTVLYQDASSGEWVIVATTSNCDSWYEHGSPVPPYWEYRLRNGKWSETKLSMNSTGRTTNLFFNYQPSLATKRITVEIKTHAIKKNSFSERYLRVDAELK